jgi:hypothetical protein
MVADNVHHRDLGLAGIVQVGQTIGQAGTQMQQCRGWFFGHPRITVRRSRHHALEQAQHRAHAGDTIQSADEVHLGRPGMAKQTSTPLATSVRSSASAPFMPFCGTMSDIRDKAPCGAGRMRAISFIAVP